jgi:hypothetical protein
MRYENLNVRGLADKLAEIAEATERDGKLPPVMTIVNHGSWRYDLIVTAR